jgi:chromosome segregation ATPase
VADLPTLLAAGGGLSFFTAACVVLLRLLGATRKLLGEADQRYRAEVKDHESTQARLDAELEVRRELQDKLGQHTWQLEALRRQVEQQTVVIGQQTVQIGQQTARIGHLEAEVARLSGASS